MGRGSYSDRAGIFCEIGLVAVVGAFDFHAAFAGGFDGAKGHFLAGFFGHVVKTIGIFVLLTIDVQN